MVAHTLNPSTKEAEADRALWAQDQHGLQSKFQDNQDYGERPCLKTPGEKKGVFCPFHLWFFFPQWEGEMFFSYEKT